MLEYSARWQNLVTRAEERHKLVTASLNFYKTAEQVCSVLDSLEREYKREDDWLARYLRKSHIDINIKEFRVLYSVIAMKKNL